MNFIEVSEELKKLQANMLEKEVPKEIWQVLWKVKPDLNFSAGMIQLGGSYSSAEEVRTALTWLCNEMGGSVEWQ